MLFILAFGATAFISSPPLARRTAPSQCLGDVPRLLPPRASAIILPVACTGLGTALVYRAAGAAGVDRVVLGAAGLLSILNLGPTDNARYAGAKRAVKVYQGKQSLPGAALAQKATAERWYTLVRLRQLGQFAGLGWMVGANSATGVLRGAAVRYIRSSFLCDQAMHPASFADSADLVLSIRTDLHACQRALLPFRCRRFQA